MRYWRTVLAQTDVRGHDGEPLYVYARVRPRWYWFLRRCCLFSRIVWRRYESDRIGVRLAWDVSSVAAGLTEKGE